MKRRHFLSQTSAALGLSSLSAEVSAVGKRAPRIVLRSSWQTVNIGDIGHTPGVLALLEKHIPEAEISFRYRLEQATLDWCARPVHVGGGRQSSR